MPIPLQQGTDNPVLRAQAKPVGQITAELKHFVVDMVKTMNFEEGVGLAAPQVNRSIRLAVVKLNPGEKNEIIFPIINPEIVAHSDEMEEGEEGCLSLPGVWGKIKRYHSLVLRYKDLKGQEQTLELSGFNARIIQHEVDHLNGTLYIDKAYEIKEKKKIKRNKN